MLLVVVRVTVALEFAVYADYSWPPQRRLLICIKDRVCEYLFSFNLHSSTVLGLAS